MDSQRRNIFYKLESNNITRIKNILNWADEKGVYTEVTMLDVKIRFGRIKSDKDFKTALNLINGTAKNYFVIILRKNMNLFGILYGKKVIKDMLEIGIRGIEADSREYFIMIYLEKKFLKELLKNYDIKRIS